VLLGQAFWLSSEGRLRTVAVVGLNDDTVGGDDITGVNLNDVTHDQLDGVYFPPGFTASDVRECYVIFHHEGLELFFLGVVIDDGDEDDDDDGDDDTSSLLDAVCEAILDDTQRGADNTGDDQDSEDEVLEDLTDHVANCAGFSHMPLV